MSSIYVPDELKERIEFYSKIHGKPQWRIIMDGVVLYEMFYKGKLQDKTGETKFPILTKAVWYIVKLSMAVGALKADTTPQRAEMLQRVIKQVKDRLGVDVSLLERAVYDYINVKLHDNGEKANPDLQKDVEIELTNALKLVALDILYNTMTSKQNT
jgi:peptidoglycan/xylan/chitin deacetylase (PgdA/CDA1 family)